MPRPWYGRESSQCVPTGPIPIRMQARTFASARHGGLMGRVCVMATHRGTNRGPVIGEWRAACMPPLHVSHHPTLAAGWIDGTVGDGFKPSHGGAGLSGVGAAYMPPADRRQRWPGPATCLLSCHNNTETHGRARTRIAGATTPRGGHRVWRRGSRQRARGGFPGTPWTPQFLTFGNGVPAIRAGRWRVVFVGAGHVPSPQIPPAVTPP